VSSIRFAYGRRRASAVELVLHAERLEASSHLFAEAAAVNASASGSQHITVKAISHRIACSLSVSVRTARRICECVALRSFRFPQRPGQQSPPRVATACPAVIGPFPHLAAGGIGERRRIGKKFHLVALAELLADQPVGDCDRFFEVTSQRRDWLRDDAIVHFYNRHPAHVLPTLFDTEWNDALDAAPIR
jgi:hypothetical protein